GRVAGSLPRSALSVAARDDVAIVQVPEELNPAELAAAVDAALTGDVHTSVRLAARGLAALERIGAAELGIDRALEALSEVLPGIGLREPADHDLGVPLIVDGVQEATLCCPSPAGPDPIRALLRRPATSRPPCRSFGDRRRPRSDRGPSCSPSSSPSSPAAMPACCDAHGSSG